MARTVAERILRRTRLDRYINRTEGRAFGRVTFQVPVVGGVFASDSEPWMSQVLDCALAVTEGAFIDVGVNLGQTLLKVAAIDRTRSYVGFEPNPTCVAYVERLIGENNLNQWSIIPVGLSSETGVVALQLYSPNEIDSSASIVPGFRPQEVSRFKYVPVFSSRDLPPDIFSERVGILKVDVEGAELEVFTTMFQHISKSRPLIITEILPAYSSENRMRVDRQGKVFSILSDIGYQFFRVVEDASGTLKGLQAVNSIEVHGDLALCNYLVCPVELVGALSARLRVLRV